MKNLKKVLALVLVVAMMASFATVSAAFPDADSITYETAVNVLSGLGVIGGYTDGTFRPTNLVTRGAMAKMVAYVMNGGVNAAASYGAAADAAFDDVDTTNTFANAIGYVVSKSIVSGYADGTFRAGNNVTGVAAAKMLLGALGYNADAEGFQNNTNWTVNVINAGEEAGLFKGMTTVDLSANLTREAAAQMIWNALNAKTVKYTTSGTTITAGDITITTGATRTEPSWAEQYTGDAEYIAGGKLELVEKCFPKFTAIVDGVDATGAPCITYKNDTKVLTNVVPEATLTYTTTVTDAEIAKALDVTVASQTGIKVQANMATGVYSGTVALSSALTNVGPGVVTKVYTNALGNITHITKVIPAVAQITSISTRNATTTTGGYTQYTIGGTNYKVYNTVVNPLTELDEIVVSGTVAPMDYVLMYKVTGMTYVSALTTVSGAVTAIASNGTVTIGGVNRVAAQAYTGATIALSATPKAYYVDSYGNLLMPVGTNNPADPTALVLDTDSYNTLVDGRITPVNTATLVNVDGSVVTVNTASDESGKVGTVVTYAANSAGLYTLTDSTADVAVTAIAPGAAGLTTSGTVYANAGTLYVFVNYKTLPNTSRVVDGTVSTVTGAANVKTYSTLSATFALDTTAGGDGIANVVFVYDDVNADATATAALFYVLDGYTQSAAGYTYDVIVNGAASTVTMATECLNTGVYSSITEGTSTASTKSADGTASLQNNGGLFFVDGTYTGKSVAANTPVYVIDNSGLAPTVSAITGADIAALTTANSLGYDTIAVYYAANALNAVTAIVIVVA